MLSNPTNKPSYNNGNAPSAPNPHNKSENQNQGHGEGQNIPNKQNNHAGNHKKSTAPVPNKDIEKHITDRYEILKRVGKGAYGIVWKARDKKSNRLCALKKIFEAFRNHTDSQRTYREIGFLNQFKNHPNIVKLINICEARNNIDIYLTFEYMDSDLHTVIRNGILEPLHKPYIIYQVLREGRGL